MEPKSLNPVASLSFLKDLYVFNFSDARTAVMQTCHPCFRLACQHSKACLLNSMKKKTHTANANEDVVSILKYVFKNQIIGQKRICPSNDYFNFLLFWFVKNISKMFVVFLYVFFCYPTIINTIFCKIYYKRVIVYVCLMMYKTCSKVPRETCTKLALSKLWANVTWLLFLFINFFFKNCILCLLHLAMPVASAPTPVSSASGNRKRQLLEMTDRC